MPSPSETSPGARRNAALCHLSAASGLVVPLGTVLGPLVAWVVLRDEDPFVDRQGRHAIDINLAFLVAEGVLFAVVVASLLLGLFGRFAAMAAGLLLVLVAVVHAAVVVYAAVKTSNGADVRIPFRLPVFASV